MASESSTKPTPATPWHRREIPDALEQLGVRSDTGLAETEVAKRRDEAGPNEIASGDARGPGRILREQVAEPMVILLLAAAAISFAIGETTDAVAVLVIVVLNAALGFVQDYRAEAAIAKLREMAAPDVQVRRGGKVLTIPARELVPGDIMLLAAGDRVTADGRVLEAHGLSAQEAALTGESQPVAKTADPVGDEDPPLGDRSDMLYMGTDITNGRGEALVTETGMHTELGRIAEMIQSSGHRKTPLQRQLARLGIRLAIAALAIVAIVFALGVARGRDVPLMLMTALSMAVAAVPEGLPAVATIALALGARRMLKRNALIRKLPAVETLGSVTVICSDKTGTLTANRMEVVATWDHGDPLDIEEETALRHPEGNGAGAVEALLHLAEKRPGLAMLLLSGTLCNDAHVERIDGASADDPPPWDGDPTEAALLLAAHRFGLRQDELVSAFPRLGEVPFDSERKRMSTLHRLDEETSSLLPGESPDATPGFLALMKGAVEAVLESCSSRLGPDGIVALDESHREEIRQAGDLLASQGQRVLGFAIRRLAGDAAGSGADPDPGALERDFVFVGLAGLLDPPRREAERAVALCRSAGIRPVMITGDHPSTALFVARQIGIADEDSVPVTGQALAGAAPAELEDLVQRTSVYARVSPEHKLSIVEALQENGEVVAMTGDGVNDAPALKKADIGVAMGITGTAVAKDAADTVLLDDNFATIVHSVEEGRTIYDNIAKFLQYTLTSNTGEILVMLAAPFLGMPLPLVPLQILWINLVTDGLPGLAMALEPSERNAMQRPPRPPDEPILTNRLIRHLLVFGFLMGAVSIGTGFFYWGENPTEAHDPSWGTIIFTVLTLSQMGHALAIRSSRDSLFRIGLLSNPWLLGAVLLTLLLQLAVIYFPPLQHVFRTEALPLSDLLLCLGISTVVFWGVELEKWLVRRRER